MAYPDNDIDDEDLWDENEDEKEIRRQRRWEPHDDDVESIVDLADFDD